jgi:predicted DNA-binding transcriptional regulator AlpA
MSDPHIETELWQRETVLRFFGGDRPLNPATLYRGMQSGRYPRPVHISGGGSVRWVASECRDALQRMMSERDGRKHVTKRAGNVCTLSSPTRT